MAGLWSVSLRRRGEIAVAVGAEEWWSSAANADLPGEVVGCGAVDADAKPVDAVEVVRRTDGDPVVAPVVAAAGAVEHVVVVQAGAGGASGDRAAPPVALEDRVAMPGTRFPLGDGVME